MLLVLLVLCWPLFASSFQIVAPQAVVDILAAQDFSFSMFHDFFLAFNSLLPGPVLGIHLSASLPIKGIEAELYIPDTSVQGCTSITPATPVNTTLAKDKIVLMKRGGCAFQEKAQNIEDTGALAAVIYNSVGDTIASGVLVVCYCVYQLV